MARVLEEERRQIVDLSMKEHSQRSIAALTGRPLKTVNCIIQAYRKEGRICDAPHRRQPQATTEQVDQLLIAAVSDDPFQTAKDILRNTSIQVHPSTVRNCLKEAGLRSHMAAQKPVLTEGHKATRLRFAHAHATWMAKDWEKVISSDESSFSTRQDQRKRVWQLENEM